MKSDSITTKNPHDNSILSEYKLMNKNVIEQKIENCSRSQKIWKQKTLIHRLTFVKNLGKVLLDNKNEYAKMITLEMGKVLHESIAEVEKCAFLCQTYVENSKEWLTPEIVKVDINNLLSCQIHPRPLGVVLSVMPWNFPFWQAVRFAVPSLVVGNGHLLRHASQTTGCSLLIEEAFQKAGFPVDLFQSLICSHQEIEAILSNPLIASLSFTGSTEVGEKLAAISGRELKKSILELGGSDPFMVFSDADVDAAAKAAATSRLMNAGQSCISAKRFLIHKDVQQSFVLKMKYYMEQSVLGNPLERATTIGPLSSEAEAIKIESWIENAVLKGAKVHLGAKRSGAYIYPTLIENVDPILELSCLEVFAPVAVIQSFESEEEVIELANKTVWGLSASLWSKNLSRAQKIAAEIESGSIFINSFSKSDPRIPFGGTKKSGWGREMGRMGLWDMSNPQTVMIY